MTIKVRPMDCHFRVSVGITANINIDESAKNILV